MAGSVAGKDIANEYTAGYSFYGSTALSASVAGTTVDFQDCEADVTVVLTHGGIAAEEDATCDIKLQTSSDDSTWSDLSGATMTQITASTSTNGEVSTFFTRNARYVRAYATIAGSSPDIVIHVTLLSQKKSY